MATQTPNVVHHASSLISYEMKAFQKQIENIFDIDPPLFTMTNDPWAFLLGRVRNTQNKLKTPFTYFMIRTVEENDTGYSPAKLAKSPYSAQWSRDKDGMAQMTRFIPALFSIEFFYVTDDAFAFLDFAEDWVSICRAGLMDLVLKYRGVELSIQIQLAPNFTIPEKDMSADVVNLAMASATAEVRGWMTNRRHQQGEAAIMSSDETTTETPNADTNGMIPITLQVGKDP